MPNPFLQASQYRTYDNYEARTGYFRFGAKNLIRRMMPEVEDWKSYLSIYDAGCGTGTSMLETLKRFPHATVTGIDDSEGMLAYARMKFGMEDPAPLITELLENGNGKLALYLREFVQNAARHARRARFEMADIMDFTGEPADMIIGSQILHWLRPEFDVPETFAELLRPGGCVGFSSSMSFYVPQHFRVETTSYLYHPFVLHFFDALSKRIEKETGRAVHAPKPKEKKHHLETTSLFESAGFETAAYDEFQLPPLPPELLLEHNLRVVPEHLGMFEGTGLPEETKARLISEAIHETLSAHLDLLPREGIQSDTCPVFVFRKLY